MLTPFKCLKFVKSFPATYSSHPLLIYAQTTFQITLFQKKSQRIGLKAWNDCGWKLQHVEFLEQIRKGVKSTRAVNKNATQFRGLLLYFYFCLGGEGGGRGGRVQGVEHTQNFRGKPNFSGVFKKAFAQQPCFFFLEQTTDRQIGLLFQVLRYI